MSPLFDTVSRWRVQPTHWGQNDCMLVLADWIAAQGHPDPAAEIRGRYDSPVSCQRVTGFLRDPVATAARYFEGVSGLSRTERPAAGDVAVLQVPQPEGLRPIGGLCLAGAVWVAKAERWGALEFIAPRVMAAWSVGHA